MSQLVVLADSIFAVLPAGTKKLFIALIFIVCIDYLTGVCAAIKEKKLSSKVGAKGIASKVTIFSLSALAVVIDHLLVGGGSTVCSLTILAQQRVKPFYQFKHSILVALLAFAYSFKYHPIAP